MTHSNARTATSSSANIARCSYSRIKSYPEWSTTRMNLRTQNNSNFQKRCSQKCHHRREKLTLLKCNRDNKTLSTDLESPVLLQATTSAVPIAKLVATFCNQLTRFFRTALTSVSSLTNVTKTASMAKSYGKPWKNSKSTPSMTCLLYTSPSPRD